MSPEMSSPSGFVPVSTHRTRSFHARMSSCALDEQVPAPNCALDEQVPASGVFHRSAITLLDGNRDDQVSGLVQSQERDTDPPGGCGGGD